MNYALLAPPNHLKDLVKCFWMLESTRSEILPKEYFLMADACPELVFQFNGGFPEYRKFNAYMRSQHTLNKRIPVGEKLGLFGVRLYPHAVQQLLNIPSYEIINEVHDFDCLFGQSAKDISEQVCCVPTTTMRMELVSGFLTEKVMERRPDLFSRFARQVIDSEGQMNFSQMLHQTGLSLKQFERRFKATAGFTPAYYARITRFQSAKRKYTIGKYTTLTELAHDCHYYDQSHFIRDFKEFSGMQARYYFKLLDKGDNESRIVKELVIGKTK
jgi:AraC-like DNA-binding protein